ncbi:MAG: polyprenyl synthetase family protein [Desulfobacterales bacterium]
MVDLDAYLEQTTRLIEEHLASLLPQEDSPGGRLIEAMRYSLFAGGKRIRPVLCLAAAEAVGGTASDALPVACALEMIHTYSLIHDDLPAMDDDALRRGKPTCHIAFDEATAILAGDGLLTFAFEIIASRCQAPPARTLAVIRLIAHAAGPRGMVRGQMLDMETQGRPSTIAQVEHLHGLKTGAMLEAALAAGALIAGGTDPQVAALRAFGRKLGLAFQVVDDILNVEGDPAIMGKAVGTDRIQGKNSYPALIGLEKSKKKAQDLIHTALKDLSSFDSRADPLRAIARYVVTRNK